MRGCFLSQDPAGFPDAGPFPAFLRQTSISSLFEIPRYAVSPPVCAARFPRQARRAYFLHRFFIRRHFLLDFLPVPCQKLFRTLGYRSIGRTTDSGPVNRGSSPRSPAKILRKVFTFLFLLPMRVLPAGFLHAPTSVWFLHNTGGPFEAACVRFQPFAQAQSLSPLPRSSVPSPASPRTPPKPLPFSLGHWYTSLP